MERCYRVQWKKIFKYLRRAKYRQECNPNKYLNFFKLFKKKRRGMDTLQSNCKAIISLLYVIG